MLNLTDIGGKSGKSAMTNNPDLEFGDLSEINQTMHSQSQKLTHSTGEDKSQKLGVGKIEMSLEADDKKEDDSAHKASA